MVAGGKTVKGRPVFYAHFVEFGVGAHEIKAVQAKALYMGQGFATEVDHPGSGPQPFMRSGFDIGAESAIELFVGILQGAVKEGGFEPAQVVVTEESDNAD